MWFNMTPPGSGQGWRKALQTGKCSGLFEPAALRSIGLGGAGLGSTDRGTEDTSRPGRILRFASPAGSPPSPGWTTR